MPVHHDQDRATAARLLAAVVVDRQTSDQALARIPAGPSSRDMFYGALRHYFSLGREVNAALRKPLRQKDMDIWCLLIVGAYQLRHSRVPDHAAINETVAACTSMKKTSLGGLVNGVLRALQRSGQPDSNPTERSFGSPADEFPPWMARLIARDFPEQATAILAASLARAPLTLRINRQRCVPDDYRKMLDAQHIGHAPGFRDEYVVLAQPQPADTLPGFDRGLIAIQDAGAGFVADLLTCSPGDRLLDACAAPGGKLFHLLECQPDLQALALDKSANRMSSLEAEARRLGHTPVTRIADAATLDWWDGEPFDAILIDAPCSGSGTLRRHPDIKVLRNESDLAGYARQQSALLRNLWFALRPGGSLLYCTCSLFAEENDAVVAEFLAVADNAEFRTIALPTGMPRKYGWQLLPIERRTDGFYFSLLNKKKPALHGASDETEPSGYPI